MAKSIPPFIVVYGDEDFLIDRYVLAKRQTLSKTHDVVLRDGSVLTEQELVGLCESRSMLDDSDRVVILDNAQDLKVPKASKAKKAPKVQPVQALVDYIARQTSSSSSCVLLAVVREKKLPDVWEAASQKGQSSFFFKFKPWESEKVVARISDEAKLLKLKLDTGVADLIYKCLGDNSRSISNELKKLAYLVPPGEAISSALVASVIAPNVPVEPWHVADAAIAKNKVQALRLMSLVYRNLGDGACVPVVSSLMKQVEKTLVVKHMLDQGEEAAIIAVRLSVHEYVCKKTLIPIARKHSVPELVGQMKKLCRLEAQVKGAARSKRTLVELALISIAA